MKTRVCIPTKRSYWWWCRNRTFNRRLLTFKTSWNVFRDKVQWHFFLEIKLDHVKGATYVQVKTWTHTLERSLIIFCSVWFSIIFSLQYCDFLPLLSHFFPCSTLVILSDKTCKILGKFLARHCKIMHYSCRKNARFLQEISVSCKSLAKFLWLIDNLARNIFLNQQFWEALKKNI